MDRWSGYGQSSEIHPAAYGRKNTGAPRRDFRGGNFADDARNARSASRDGAHPEYRGRDLGFRPARVSTG
jgi:formylglycine-generating enzyme required for sulfatase activity